MIYRNFSKRQILAMTWWNRPGLKEREGLICDGAVRSGKTVCMADGFFIWSMAAFQGQNFALCGRSISSLRRNVISNLEQWLGGLLQIRENRSTNCLTVRYKGRENHYYLFGGLDESSYKQIQGITLAGALLDEVALMPRSFVEQAVARCSVDGSKLWFNCNPAGPEHWFYKEWIRKAAQKNLLHLHFTMADNPGLSPRIIARYESLYTGTFYNRYILGQWCIAQGLVYAFDPKKHLTRQIPAGGRYYISVDYGTCNPFSAGLWWVGQAMAIRVREYYYDGRKAGVTLTDEQYYSQLEQLAGSQKIEQVIVDPSAASFIAVIRRHGRFSVRRANNAVADGIRLVSSFLHAGVLRFHPDCADTVREFGLYRWEEQGDSPVKENDHTMDDIRYFCATVLRRDKLITERLGLTDEKMAD